MRGFKQQIGELSRIIFVGFCLFLGNFGEVQAQLACEGTLPFNFTRPWNRPADSWDGYVFQISPDYDPKSDWNRDFTGLSAADPTYKGYLLRDGNHFLPAAGLAFDTQFSDYSVDGYSRDSDFFTTGDSPTATGGCDAQLSHFGVILRSKKTIDEPGIYKVSIGSDDGSFFRMFENGNVGDFSLDVNGDPVRHDNWYKNGGDGLYDFVYSENIRNYYVPFEDGDSFWMDLHYYERIGNSRLSFDFELYFGPGEVENPGNATGIRSYCGIAPDPEPFASVGPAVFAEGSEPSYQWEYTSVANPTEADWIEIPGATGLGYDIPKYDASIPENSWTGTRYFRRVARNVVVDGEGNILENSFSSNILEVSIQVIADLDQAEYGLNEWIGHVYAGVKNFDSENYLGRVTEDAVFVQHFTPGGSTSSPVIFTPDYGCSFITDRFSIRYKMRLDVEPGTLNFTIRADDGFRLSLDGGVTWALYGQWESGGSTAKEYTTTFDVPDGMDQLDLVMEYYENTQRNTMDFDYEFVSLVLPLQWGNVEGQACGENNCLNWETLQEKNTSHFVLERSPDGFSWKDLDHKIPSQGETNGKVQYQAVDSTFEASWSYYRIRQVDRDGKSSYSEVIRISNDPVTESVLPFPNPTTDFIHFDEKEAILQVELISQDQRIRLEPDLEKIGKTRYRIDLRHYPSNHYLISLSTNKGKRTFKIFKR
ncbi:T9SS type A sorting domain-containing protein [Cyclobacterium roseum]|uniref:T9SS type A sorting domain-containing protein n=1 Tax=Cyclobacterium roseum TaxID=2666137 RepID=UPI001391975A|nr:T9SS type A sorting domain-containing protein [Cyclobacterium roseum]